MLYLDFVQTPASRRLVVIIVLLVTKSCDNHDVEKLKSDVYNAIL